MNHEISPEKREETVPEYGDSWRWVTVEYLVCSCGHFATRRYEQFGASQLTPDVRVLQHLVAVLMTERDG